MSENASARASDILWTYLHLDHPTVTPKSASSTGRWNLLEWARATRKRFYRHVLPRAITKSVCSPCPAPPVDDMSLEEIAEEIRRAVESYNKYDAHGASPELLAEVRGLLQGWSQQWSVRLSEECSKELTYCLAGCVQQATQRDSTWIEESEAPA